MNGNDNRKGVSATSGDGLGTAARRAQAAWPTPKASTGDKAGRPRPNDRGDLQAAALRWPTPTARDRKGAYPQQRRGQTGKGGPDLATAVLWPTPTAADAERTSPAYPGGNPTLTGAARRWPTPTASNPNERETLESWIARRERERAKGHNGNGMGTPLGVAVRLWPTPTAADGTSGPGQAPTAEGSPDLRTTVTGWATPKASDGHGRGSAKQDRGGRRNLVDQVPSALNPEWVEALMGFPRGWTRTAGRPPRARRSRGSRPAPSAPARSPTAPSG